LPGGGKKGKRGVESFLGAKFGEKKKRSWTDNLKKKGRGGADFSIQA